MPRLAPTAELAKTGRRLESERRHRFVELAVRLRALGVDGALGELIPLPGPGVIGGVWDSWEEHWVNPTPPDIEAAEWTIQRQQIPIFLGSQDALWVGIFGGRQSGKTREGLMEVGRDGMRWPGWESFVVAQDYKAAVEHRDTLEALFPKRWRTEWVAHEKTFRWVHGHQTKLRSAENISACRGPNTKTLMLDEAAFLSRADFLAAVGSGLASPGFRLVVPTTPKREVDWIREAYRDWGTPAMPRSLRLNLQTEDNPFRNLDLLALIAKNTPADLYDQEFKGKLVPPQHAVYYLFDQKVHERPEPSARLDVTREFCAEHFGVGASLLMGWDFGREAVVVGKVFRHSYSTIDALGRRQLVYVERLWIVGEAVNDRTTTEHHAWEVAQKWGTDAVVITDAMGAHDRAIPGRAPTAAVRLLREAGFLKVRPVAEANPDVEQRIRTVLRLLKSSHRTVAEPEGEVRLLVAPGACPVLEEALENQERDVTGKPTKDKPAKDGRQHGRQHVLDALGYLVYAAFPIRGEMPEGFSRTAGVR